MKILKKGVPVIKEMVVVEVFGPGTLMEEIVKFFKNL
jgi:hypothetical protein